MGQNSGQMWLENRNKLRFSGITHTQNKAIQGVLTPMPQSALPLQDTVPCGRVLGNSRHQGVQHSAALRVGFYLHQKGLRLGHLQYQICCSIRQAVTHIGQASTEHPPCAMPDALLQAGDKGTWLSPEQLVTAPGLHCCCSSERRHSHSSQK